MIDIRLAFRTLAKTPFVTAVVIASPALGIGANSAIFSLFDQIVLRPLPVPEPGQLVNFAAPGPQQGSNSRNQAGRCDEPRRQSRQIGRSPVVSPPPNTAGT